MILRTCHPKWCSVMSQKTGSPAIDAVRTLLLSSNTHMWPCSVCCFFTFACSCISKTCWWFGGVCVLQDCGDLEIFSVVTGSISLLLVLFLIIIVASLHMSLKKWVQPCLPGGMSLFRSSADRSYLLHCDHARQHKEWNLQNHYFTFCFMWVRNLVSYIKWRTQAESVGE